MAFLSPAAFPGLPSFRTSRCPQRRSHPSNPKCLQPISMAASGTPPPQPTSATATSQPETMTKPQSRPPFTWLNNWYPVAFVVDIPDLKPLSVKIWGHNYVLFRDRTTGHYVVMDDVCPHRAAPLSEGRVYERQNNGKSETILECGYHGWRFNCTGRCVDIPVVSLEKRIPSAADVAGLYATTVAVGTVFVWLGDRAEADESKLRIPPEVREEENLFVFGETVRRMPVSFTTLLENLVDPIHLHFLHHGTSFARRHLVGRTGRITMVEDDMERGFMRGALDRGKGGYVASTTFQAPIQIELNSRTFMGEEPEPKAGLVSLVWVLPVDHDECEMFSVAVFPKAPWFARVLLRFRPRWMLHFEANDFADGDARMLYLLEQRLQKKKRDGWGGEWRKDYVFASKSFDDLVVKMKMFLEKHVASMPYATSIPSVSRNEGLSRRDVLDRYKYHTQYCSSCKAALKNVRRGLVAALVVAGVGVVVMLLAGLVFLTVPTARVAPGARGLAWTAVTGVSLCMVMLLVAERLNRWRELLTHTNIAYELQQAD